MKKIKLLLIVFTLFFSVAGCGYSTKSMLPEGLDTIYVANFTNEIDPSGEISDRRATYTYRPGLEMDITRAVIDGFIRDRHLRIDSEKRAKLTLEGALIEYRQYPLSYDKGDSVVELRVQITVDLTLKDNTTGKIMWQESNFVGESTYDITGPNAITEATAAGKAVDDLAQRIVELVVEAW
jgi:hypothetical protein